MNRKTLSMTFSILFVVSLILPVVGLVISLTGNLAAGAMTAHAMFPLGAVSVFGMTRY